VNRYCALFWLVSACSACDLTHLGPVSAQPPSIQQSFAKGQFRRPLESLKTLVAQKPDDPVLNWQMARALSGVGDFEAAMPFADKAATAEPSSATYHVEVAAIAGMQAQRASLFKQLGLAKRAKKELDLAYALDSKNIDALYGLMLFDYAAPAMLGGDKAKAQQMADAIGALNPVRGYAAQAELAAEQKNFEKQQAVLQQALGSKPDLSNPDVYAMASSLASLYRTQDKFAKAEALGCAMVQQDPARIDGWRVLIAMRAHDQCWNEVDDLLTQAHRRVPEDWSGYYAAADEMTRMGHHLRTAEGWLRLYLSKPVEGNAPSLAAAHAELARILEKHGQVPEAIAELEAAVSQDANLEAARKDLKRLKKTS
jgi:tetratricopeptide (TPR) repeat protein